MVKITKIVLTRPREGFGKLKVNGIYPAKSGGMKGKKFKDETIHFDSEGKPYIVLFNTPGNVYVSKTILRKKLKNVPITQLSRPQRHLMSKKIKKGRGK